MNKKVNAADLLILNFYLVKLRAIEIRACQCNDIAVAIEDILRSRVIVLMSCPRYEDCVANFKFWNRELEGSVIGSDRAAFMHFMPLAGAVETVDGGFPGRSRWG